MKFVVLLSSGLDSTVNFYKAKADGQIALALTFNYGQKAALKEIEHAQRLCREFNVLHQIVDLSWFSRFSSSALTLGSNEVPKNTNLVSQEDCEKSAAKVWVPNRNGIFLNIAAGVAENLKADFVVPGFNAEEAATFPDNSKEFIEACNNSLEFSTMGRVKIKCYTQNMHKKEIVSLGKQLGVRFDLIWPCYLGGEKICGICESCQRYLRATS